MSFGFGPCIFFNSGLTCRILGFCNKELLLEQYAILDCIVFLKLGTISKAGLTQPQLVSESKAFGLSTEAWPWTAGPTVAQFMSAWHQIQTPPSCFATVRILIGVWIIVR